MLWLFRLWRDFWKQAWSPGTLYNSALWFFVCIRSTSRAVASSSQISASSVGKDSPQSMVSWYTKGHVGPLSASCVRLPSSRVKSKNLTWNLITKTLSDSPVSWFKPILWLNKIELTPLAVLLLVKWMSLLPQWLCLETTRYVGIGNSTCPVLMWRVMDYYCKPCHILRINILSFSYAFFLYADLSPNYCCKPCNISHI